MDFHAIFQAFKTEKICGPRQKRRDLRLKGRCRYRLPFEGETESDVGNSFLVADRRRARAIRIELYRNQYDQ